MLFRSGYVWGTSMTPQELTEKLKPIIATNQQYTTWTVSTPHLILLVEQAVAEEREACAKLCEEKYEYYGHDHIFAKAIRARGEEK